MDESKLFVSTYRTLDLSLRRGLTGNDGQGMPEEELDEILSKSSLPTDGSKEGVLGLASDCSST